MPDDPHNVRERLFQAVSALATSAKPIQDRLESAGVALAPLRADEFADERTRATFTAIMDLLRSAEPRRDEGKIRATTANLSDEQAARVARLIVDLDAAYRPPYD